MNKPNENVYRGCPTFYRIHCAEARQGGPRNSYQNAGYHLGLHCFELTRGCVPDPKLAELEQLLSSANSDISAIWGWLVENLPLCMALVPVKRKDIFITGFLEATEDGW